MVSMKWLSMRGTAPLCGCVAYEVKEGEYILVGKLQ